MNKVVTKWLSTQALFYPDNVDADVMQKYKDDPTMLKALGLSDVRPTEKCPQLIDLDSVVAANPSTHEGITTIFTQQGVSMMIVTPYEKFEELLRERELYLEETRTELLKNLASKLAL